MRKTRSQRILNRQKNKVRMKEEWKRYEEWKRELWECVAVSKADGLPASCFSNCFVYTNLVVL